MGERRLLALKILVWAQILVCALSSSAAAEAQVWFDPKLVTDVRIGIFCSPDSPYLSSSPDTTKGTTERYSKNPVLVSKTQTIPAINRIMFGIETRQLFRSLPKVMVTIRHPPIGPSRARTERWESWPDDNQITSDGYILDPADGDLTGIWTISGTRGSEEVFRVAFKVVKPKKGDSNPCVAPSS
ncbi:MAG TPA: DUF3859 domain-containing protein [Albidovulum sp.]|uniref:hypothetical protein n=1 Tax=Albidovulum sp. TaxID=1872424 RepID=UPI002BF06594|nr:DUF3859 domain-containing protein [Albidovulum sp.]